MKNILTIAVVVLLGAGGYWFYTQKANAKEITVYKSPTCGCCEKWVHHLEANGFDVKVENTNYLQPIKDKYGVAKELSSCHTAIVDGYVVEGHVPASVIHTFLKEHPAVKGLAVPGMPNGSPGMEGNGFKENYNVFAFDGNGNASVYSRQ